MTVDQPDRRPRPTRHRGPVVLRGGEPSAQYEGSTTDQRLAVQLACRVVNLRA